TTKRVAINPLTRVEGHGKVTLLLDQEDRVQQVRLHIVEFRGFEKFIQDRPYWEVPSVVQRLCGICPVSHALAAGKAVDMLVGAKELTPTAEKIRRLLHFGQVLQSHAVHFFHLASPDLLFGFDGAAAQRNIVGVISDHPEIARKGVGLRKFGQEVICAITGKRVHGTGVVPGGVNKALSRAERDHLLADVDRMIAWGQDAVRLSMRIYEANRDQHEDFAAIRSSMMSLVRQDGALELYHGGLRTTDEHGEIIFDHLDYRNYGDYIHERVKSWSYMKFPFIVSLGEQAGWYRVGPLARVNNCDFIPTERAEAARREFMAQGDGGPVQPSLRYHCARMIEVLHAAEGIKELLLDEHITGADLVTSGQRTLEGIGVIEAPRGTLFHHYQTNEQGIVEKANLIVSTTSNNQAMNEAIRDVARKHLDGRKLTEPLLNHIEVAVRAYDPCLSCATHALGKMPLALELVDDRGEVVDSMVKSFSGEIGTGSSAYQ
ncbi:MAG: Ni/Fe hydrogenase subunit alpha, partial [bacterium]|nr:Ni/Fe hydrogenase subunit alpha [bacterium]